MARPPDESKILSFRHLPRCGNLALDVLRPVTELVQTKGQLLRTVTAVNCMPIAAPSPSLMRNAEGERDRKPKQTKKGNHWNFGMKPDFGSDGGLRPGLQEGGGRSTASRETGGSHTEITLLNHTQSV